MNCHRATAATETERGKEKERRCSPFVSHSLSPSLCVSVSLWHNKEESAMCRVSRRELLLGGAALLGAAATKPKANAKTSPANPAAVEVGKVDQLSDGVYFHQGNLLVGHCNNGWIIFEDYVLVIDANYPSGAQEII